MIQGRKELARVAIAKALRVRKQAGIDLAAPVNVFDLAERLGIEVRFWDVPSMEGLYLPMTRPRPTIVVSSLRPPGRQASTCGHELGHHVFGHGAQIDELLEDRSSERSYDPAEFQADCFSGALLMTKVAVNRAFSARGWTPKASPPEAFYTIATWLGVGYATLIQHMVAVLRELNSGRAEQLRRARPLDIRSRLLGRECRPNLVIADEHWADRAIDLQASDLAILPAGCTAEGACLQVVESSSHRTVVVAVCPGVGRVGTADSSWSAYARVSRQGYVGRAKHRFEEEVEDDE